MLGYILRRLLLVIPTLLGIMVINFAIIQFAPGGPVEQAIAEWQGLSVEKTMDYPGWQPDFDSELLALGKSVYGELP